SLRWYLFDGHARRRCRRPAAACARRTRRAGGRRLRDSGDARLRAQCTDHAHRLPLRPNDQKGAKVLDVKIFVTGGSGHLGANLVRRLLQDKHEIVALAQEGANNRGITEGLDGKPISIVYGDIRDPSSFADAMKGCQVAFHTAAMIVTTP